MVDDEPTHGPQPSTERVGFVVRSMIAGQCASALEDFQKINPPARSNLASKLLNDRAISRKSGRGKDVGKRKAEKEVRVMMNPGKKKTFDIGCEGIKAEDELVVKFLKEWRPCNREERTSRGIKGRSRGNDESSKTRSLRC